MAKYLFIRDGFKMIIPKIIKYISVIEKALYDMLINCLSYI